MGTIGVAAASQIAADAGAAMADGGNAVDAALAAAATSLCTEPGVMCAGGSGFVTIWPPDGDPLVIDGYAEIPRGDGETALGDGIDTVTFDYGGLVTQGVGYGAVAAPGAFAGERAAARDVPGEALPQPADAGLVHGGGHHGAEEVSPGRRPERGVHRGGELELAVRLGQGTPTGKAAAEKLARAQKK